jgi:hypothetical protein
MIGKVKREIIGCLLKPGGIWQLTTNVDQNTRHPFVYVQSSLPRDPNRYLSFTGNIVAHWVFSITLGGFPVVFSADSSPM